MIDSGDREQVYCKWVSTDASKTGIIQYKPVTGLSGSNNMLAYSCTGLTAPALSDLVSEKIAAMKIAAEHRNNVMNCTKIKADFYTVN